MIYWSILKKINKKIEYISNLFWSAAFISLLSVSFGLDYKGNDFVKANTYMDILLNI